MRFLKYAILFVAFLMVISSCPTPPAEEEDEVKTVTLYSVAAEDGSVTWWGGTDNVYSVNDNSIDIGDWEDYDLSQETTIRAFVSFNMSSIPSSIKKIKSAVLRMYQNSSSSGVSYGLTGLGDVIICVVSYDGSDFLNPGTNWNAVYYGTTPLATSFSANTWHQLDVTEALNYELDVVKSGRLQFMIKHEGENNEDAYTLGTHSDTDGWVMGDSTTNQPQLIIKYTK